MSGRKRQSSYQQPADEAEKIQKKENIVLSDQGSVKNNLHSINVRDEASVSNHRFQESLFNLNFTDHQERVRYG